MHEHDLILIVKNIRINSIYYMNLNIFMQINVQVISSIFCLFKMIHTCRSAQNSKTFKVLSARVTDNDSDDDDYL